MDDLKAFKVPVLILSGGEPLLHPDIFTISQRARDIFVLLIMPHNQILISQRARDIFGLKS